MSRSFARPLHSLKTVPPLTTEFLPSNRETCCSSERAAVTPCVCPPVRPTVSCSFSFIPNCCHSPSLPFPSLPIIPALMTVQNEPDFRRRRSAPLEVRMVFSLGERDKSGWTRSRPADGHGQSWLFARCFGGGRKEQRCNMISPGVYSRVTAQNARQVVVRPTLLPLSPILANGSRWSRRRPRALALGQG